MSIGLQTNTSALHATKILALTKKEEDEKAKRLASGFRINSAKDDASGLSISQKMKAQITMYEQASENSQSGVALVQTADGAMDQIHGMLNRMTELTTQASNGIRSQGIGGQVIQAEINALTAEIDRVAQSTNFNGVNLLDGSLETGTVNVDVTAAESLQVTSNIGGVETSSSGASVSSAGFSDFGDSITINDMTYTLTDDGSGDSFEDQVAKLSQSMQDVWGGDLAIGSDGSISGVTSTDGYVSKTSYGNALTLQIGTSSSSYDSLSIGIKSMTSSSLGISGLDVTSPSSAAASLDLVKSAINSVSATRSDLGAVYNRLDYNISNLNSSAQSLTDANSKIEDADIAKEIIEFAKKKAQKQATQYAYTQSNQNNKIVASLLYNN